MKRAVLIFTLILCSLVADIGFCKESGPDVIKVRGMYIGMDIKAFCRLRYAMIALQCRINDFFLEIDAKGATGFRHLLSLLWNL